MCSAEEASCHFFERDACLNSSQRITESQEKPPIFMHEKNGQKVRGFFTV
jgi:hypothetical protein